MIVRAFALAGAAVIAAASAAFAVDHSARDASPRSPTELCCVDVALATPDTKKKIYEVFLKAGTPEWEKASAFALPLIWMPTTAGVTFLITFLT